jgi:hypothetical protein
MYRNGKSNLLLLFVFI